MPKTNHNRQFTDERDYSVEVGDHVCGKHGVANQRRGLKKGVNRANRTRMNQVTQRMAKGDEEVLMPVVLKAVGHRTTVNESREQIALFEKEYECR